MSPIETLRQRPSLPAQARSKTDVAEQLFDSRREVRGVSRTVEERGAVPNLPEAVQIGQDERFARSRVLENLVRGGQFRQRISLICYDTDLGEKNQLKGERLRYPAAESKV